MPSSSREEKNLIQALDHPQPGLPMKKGRAGTITMAMHARVVLLANEGHAPDIVEAILAGTQPVELTVEEIRPG